MYLEYTAAVEAVLHPALFSKFKESEEGEKDVTTHCVDIACSLRRSEDSLHSLHLQPRLMKKTDKMID